MFSHSGWDVGLIVRLLLSSSADDIPIDAKVLASRLVSQSQGNGITQSSGSAAHSGSTACPTGTSPLLGGSTPGVIRVYQEGNAKPNGQGEGHQLHNRRRTSPPDEGHLWFLDLWSQPVLLMEMLIVTQKVLMEAGSEYLSFLSDLSFHLVRVQVVGRQHCVYATLIKAWQ